MRLKILLAALAASALAACTANLEKAVSKHEAAPGEGWTMQVLGEADDQVFLVTGPDGKTAAARAAGGKSTLMADAEAQALLAEAQTAFAADLPDEKVSIEAPGVSIKVSANDDATGGNERGAVRIAVGGISINVDGDDAGGNGRGTVRIAGVNAEAAHKFIDDAEDLSPEVKRQMREKLGL